jgi:hypothetical protein
LPVGDSSPKSRRAIRATGPPSILNQTTVQ